LNDTKEGNSNDFFSQQMNNETSSSTHTYKSTKPPATKADLTAKKYQNAKSISSDELFGKGRYEDDPEDSTRFANLSNATSIGSDQFFGREVDSDEEAGIDLVQLKDAANSFWNGFKEQMR
jgi:hypothetical protein